MKIYQWGALALLLVPIKAYLRTPLVPVREPVYERNAHAEFCRRKTEIVDTIVFHHTETPVTTTAERINEMHLQRGTEENPWYMIAYHYTINAPYIDGLKPNVHVSRGRQFHIAGSHAGSGIFRPVSSETLNLIKQDNAVRCGTETGVISEAEDKTNEKDEAKANYTTVAIAVIGNYAARSQANPGGYPFGLPRYPSPNTMEVAAKLACQIQKEYPRVKNIKWHSFYNATSCPGQIKARIDEIKSLAEKYGCAFN